MRLPILWYWILAALALTGCSSTCKRYPSPIKSIGACDHRARCGVMLEDGTVLTYVTQPVVGAGVQEGCY